MASINHALALVKHDPHSLFDPETVGAACRDANHRWRRRTLDPVRTLTAFALQVLHGNTAIAHVAQLMGGGFGESAYCQARARLPVAVLSSLLESTTARALAEAGRDGLWRGHRTVLMDGFVVSTPDTPALREAFGVRGGAPPAADLPMVHTLARFDAPSGLVLGLHAAPARTHDARHAHRLHPELRPGDVVVGDRGFCAYTPLATLAAAGCHGVFRMSERRAMPFPAKAGPRTRRAYNRHRRSEPVLVELISEDDQVVEIVKPSNRGTSLTPGEFACIPARLIVRALRYTVRGPGVRTRRITLLTTLTDASRYPANEIAELYRTRWRVEQNIRHLKRTMGMHRLKCRSVEGIAREMMMFAIIYNAACRVRALAARARGAPASRLSFVDALRALAISAARLAHRPEGPGVELRLWPPRSPRTHPRQLRRPHSNYTLMTRPRSEVIRRSLHRQAQAN